MVAKKKEKLKGEYRNLQPMEGRPGLYEFEVKLKSGEWQRMTNIGGDTEADRKAIAERTAQAWSKR